jgi:hypothetical protein
MDRVADMSTLDRCKERISYLKVWLGLSVVVDISLSGWFMTHISASGVPRLGLCVLAMFGLAAIVLILHRKIVTAIEGLEDL